MDGAATPTGEADAAHRWRLANGSEAAALPTTGGRSYTASVVIVDEADFIPNLDALLAAVKPTVDAGGQLFLISTADKARPESAFKRTYRAAKQGLTEWAPLFLPWWARPGRTAAWYEAQRLDSLHTTGAPDRLHENYPATDAEALAPRELDRRLPNTWLGACHAPAARLDPLPAGAPRCRPWRCTPPRARRPLRHRL